MALAPALAAVAMIALAVPDMPGRPVPDTDAFRDEDLDGVPDLRDHCPGTTHDYPVTADGCELDQDADGVADGADRCPGTRPRARGFEEPVGADGCSVRDGKKERSLPDDAAMG